MAHNIDLNEAVGAWCTIAESNLTQYISFSKNIDFDMHMDYYGVDLGLIYDTVSGGTEALDEILAGRNSLTEGTLLEYRAVYANEISY